MNSTVIVTKRCYERFITKNMIAVWNDVVWWTRQFLCFDLGNSLIVIFTMLRLLDCKGNISRNICIRTIRVIFIINDKGNAQLINIKKKCITLLHPKKMSNFHDFYFTFHEKELLVWRMKKLCKKSSFNMYPKSKENIFRRMKFNLLL